MKTNQRTIKVYDSTHQLASKLSQRFGLSMTALIELLVIHAEKLDSMELPARDPRSKKSNIRKVMKGKVA